MIARAATATPIATPSNPRYADPRYQRGAPACRFRARSATRRSRRTTSTSPPTSPSAAAHYADDPIEQSFIRQIAYARPPLGARVEMYPVCEDLGREMMEDVLESDVPVDRALTEAARLMDAALAR